MKQYQKPLISEWAVNKKRVFLRTDFNVPFFEDQILDDFRLQNGIETLEYLIQKGATVFVVTHLSRPKGSDQKYSTKILLPWFKKAGFEPLFIENPLQDSLLPLLDNSNKKQFYLFENVRFYKEETDETLPLEIRTHFAKKLIQHATFYINDAFSVSHRDNVSVTIVANLFSPINRSLGFSCYKEIIALEKVISEKQRPCALVIAGAKIEDKIILIKHLLKKIDLLLLCPAIVHPFLSVTHAEIGFSLTTEKANDHALEIIKKAEENSVKIVFPIDYVVSEIDNSESFFIKKTSMIQKTDTIISIGPETLSLFDSSLDSTHTHTIFINGICGFLEKPKSMLWMNNLFKIIAKKHAYRIVCGGDSLAALKKIDLESSFDFLSPGGGATLAFLSNNKMPGISLFKTP